eukprot:TRINITY_DN50769_c0_g1_i1.p2 TRINITY_DN50769_c0_g1~~TRINITY_DN50769_c0_g1_i1.p2  ORF type:complete len:525 (+),score=153.78 TRINITY_DN50769_c0_g1_i1:99-1577(+)
MAADEEVPLLEARVAVAAGHGAKAADETRSARLGLYVAGAAALLVLGAALFEPPRDGAQAGGAVLHADAGANGQPTDPESGGAFRPKISLSFFAFALTCFVQVAMVGPTAYSKARKEEKHEPDFDDGAVSSQLHADGQGWGLTSDDLDPLDFLAMITYLFVIYAIAGFGIVWLGVGAGIISTALRIPIAVWQYGKKGEDAVVYKNFTLRRVREIRALCACGGISFIIIQSLLNKGYGRPWAYFTFAISSLCRSLLFFVGLCSGNTGPGHEESFTKFIDNMELLLQVMYVFAIAHDCHLMWVGAWAGLLSSMLSEACICNNMLPYKYTVLRAPLACFAILWMNLWSTWALWTPEASMNMPFLCFVGTAMVPVCTFAIKAFANRSGILDSEKRPEAMAELKDVIQQSCDKLDIFFMMLYLFVMWWSKDRISRTLGGSMRIGLGLAVATTALGLVVKFVPRLQGQRKWRLLLGCIAVAVIGVNGVFILFTPSASA